MASTDFVGLEFDVNDNPYCAKGTVSLKGRKASSLPE